MTISGKVQVDSISTGLPVENKADIRPVLSGRIEPTVTSHPLDMIYMCLLRAFLNKSLAACLLAPACRSRGCDRRLGSVKAIRFCLCQGIGSNHYLR